jgi:acetyl-CoA synthetase
MTHRSLSPADGGPHDASPFIRERLAAILNDFHDPEASAPALLCDRHDPGSVAFRFVSEDLEVSEMTFGELRLRSERVAHALASRGIQAGDRVASLLGKGPDLPVLILGIWRLGAVYVPLFTAFAAGAVADRVAAADVRLIVTDRDQLPKVDGLDCTIMLANERTDAPALETDLTDLSAAITAGERWTSDVPVRGPNAPIVQMATSGTTGKPKVVVHPLAYAAGWQSYLELAINPGKVFWCGADPGWAYGLYLLIVAPLASGIPAVFTCGTFKPALTWRVLSELGVTDFTAAPTALRALRTVDDGTPLPHLRGLSSAGEPLTPEVIEWSTARFGVAVHDHFGQTELGMPAGFPHHPDLAIDVVPGAMGTSLPGWSMTVLKHDADAPAATGEVGRLAVEVAESPFFTFTGYGIYRDNRSSRFTGDGRYYITGDLASLGADDLIRFSSRDDDVILMAGYRIGPFDVESVLVTHPGVAECAVVAAPDEVRGEVIHAYVVPSGPVEDPDALTLDLQEWVRTKYAAHAYPRLVSLVDALPKTPSGKIQRAVLRQQSQALAAAGKQPVPDR